MGASQPSVSLNEVHTLLRLIIHRAVVDNNHNNNNNISHRPTSEIHPHLRPGQERYKGGEEAASFDSVRSCSVLFMIRKICKTGSELIK